MWRGALLLADYILFRRDLFQGRTVLELGAGTGLASIIAATVAQTVYCTGNALPSRATGELFLHKGYANWIKEGGRATGNLALAALDSALLPVWFSPPLLFSQRLQQVQDQQLGWYLCSHPLKKVNISEIRKNIPLIRLKDGLPRWR